VKRAPAKRNEEALRLMLEDLARSGLTAGDAAQSGMTPTAPVWVNGHAGYLIPYWDRDGQKRKDVARWRYTPPLRDQEGKEQKYTQPAGIVGAYFSPLFPWAAHLRRLRRLGENRKDSDFLALTEGEKKAARACKDGLPVIGLGGAWCYRREGEPLISDLASLRWDPSYRTYVIADSDASTKLDVMRAAVGLCRELLAKGADVYLVLLPELKRGKKCGLDDYLEAKGRTDLVKLLHTAESWAGSRQLHELNEDFVFVRDPGNLVVQLSTMVPYSTHVFTSSLEAPRHWDKPIPVKATDTREAYTRHQRVSAAKAWVEWENRNQVQRVTYQPGSLPSIEGPDGTELNMWRGFLAEPVEGDVTLWLKYLDYYFEKSPPKERVWLMKWLAYPIRYPGAKLFTAVIAHGSAAGSGKSLLGLTMSEIYGERNYSAIKEKDLHGNFNAWARNKQFVMGEEITGTDKRGESEELKFLITNPTIRINIKYVPDYEVPCKINFYFTSNEPDSFYIHDEDRRFFVHEVLCGNLEERDPQFVLDYVKWIESAAGRNALMYWLLHHVDLDGWNPHGKALVTEARNAMVDAGRSDLDSWVARLKTDPASVLQIKPSDPTLALRPATGPTAPDTRTLLTLRELYAYWDPTGKERKAGEQGLNRGLRKGGFRMVGQLSLADGTRPRVWAVQNGENHTREALGNLRVDELKAIYLRERNKSQPKKTKY
jgi:hypothetical protein